MANQKDMTVRHAIVRLYNQGWSKSRIARELGIYRGTVSRYIEIAARESTETSRDNSKPAEVPTGNDGSKPAEVPAGNPRSNSLCAPYHGQIILGMEKGLDAQRIWQDLRTDFGYEGSYDSVKRYVRKQKSLSPQRVWRMETLPGEEAQIDFGTGAWIKGDDGRKRRSWIFRITLSCSRKGYTEAVLSQNSETFIRCLENSFRDFGGVPQTLSIDNLRAAVTKADWYEPEIHPKLESFCRHYGTLILPCRVRTPQHKGKVESNIKYVKNNALKGREFDSLTDENMFLREWERSVADNRIHGTTRRQVRTHFEDIEKPALKPLPQSLFPCFQEGQRKVHRDSYIEVNGSYYEVPCEYIGRQVWVRWDSRTVRIFNRDFEQIRLYAARSKGQFSSSLGARGRRFETVVEDMTWWLRKCAVMGESCGIWAIEVSARLDVRSIRVMQGLLSLKKRHTSKEINEACKLAISQSRFHLRDVKALLKQPQKQENFEFMTEHTLIRNMNEYGEILEVLEQNERRNMNE